MDKRLYQAGIIAIPLLPISDTTKPNPNFLVFENQFGKLMDYSPNIQTGDYEITECVNSVYKLVYREILPANNLFQEEFSEKLFISPENLSLPVSLLPYVFSYQSLKYNIQIVNRALSHFVFRGSLQGLILEVDEDMLDEIITNENNQ